MDLEALQNLRSALAFLLADWAKAQFLAIIIASFLAGFFTPSFRKSPRRWWLYFWILSLPIILFIVFHLPLRDRAHVQ